MQNACAYHDYSPSPPNTNVRYVFDLVPDAYSTIAAECQSVQNNGQGEQLPSLTETTSHEFAEAATDPKLTAWYDSNPYSQKNPTSTFEVADMCTAGETIKNTPWPGPPDPATYLPGTTQSVVQLIYSKSTNSCRGEGAGGYWQVSAAGNVYHFGTANFYGSPYASHLQLASPIVGMAATPDGKGYWLVTAFGQVFAYGDARFYGQLHSAIPSPGVPSMITGIAAMPNGQGYWLVGASGGVYAFSTLGSGKFYFHGSESGKLLAGYIIYGIYPTPDAQGYWLIDNYGNAYSFGDANYIGSISGSQANGPNHIMGVQVAANAQDFWAEDTLGGLYTGGPDRLYYGSLTGQLHSSQCMAGQCVNSMSAIYEGLGYYLQQLSGGVFQFGDASFYGNIAWRCTEVVHHSEQFKNCQNRHTIAAGPLVSMAVSPS